MLQILHTQTNNTLWSWLLMFLRSSIPKQCYPKVNDFYDSKNLWNVQSGKSDNAKKIKTKNKPIDKLLK